MDATVISTRIRLARNVDGLPFPHKLKRADALNIIDGVTRALAPRSEEHTSELQSH